jgi:general secretion pathway protein M
MASLIQNNPLQPLIVQGRERFLALSARERWIVGVGAVALLLTVVYLLAVEPLLLAHRRQLDALASARAMATQLEAAAAAVASAGPRGDAAQAGAGMSLLAAVDQSTRQAGPGKAPERLQPEGDHEVKIWFEDVPFDNLVRWLAQLQTSYGVKVQTLDIEAKPGAGLVDARLSLVRGGA